MRFSRVVERLAANAKVVTALGSITASPTQRNLRGAPCTWQIKQC
jgi:hypothetical protein